ncbi:MAG: hypothetical protein ABSC17_08225 [Thermacetogeniaceae bacterium]
MKKAVYITSILIGVVLFSAFTIGIHYRSLESQKTKIVLSGSRETKEALEGSLAKGYVSLQELNNDSDIVAIGSFDKIIDSGTLPNTKLPFTDFAFVPEKILKGSFSGSYILVHQLGGNVTGQGIVDMKEDPLYSIGEKSLLFLKKGTDKYYTIGAYQGRFPIRNNKISSLNYAFPARISATPVDIPPMSLDDFYKQLGQ